MGLVATMTVGAVEQESRVMMARALALEMEVQAERYLERVFRPSTLVVEVVALTLRLDREGWEVVHGMDMEDSLMATTTMIVEKMTRRRRSRG